jgi:outer membrane protein assembly factor BamB
LHQPGAATAIAVTPGHVVLHARRSRLLSLDPRDGGVRWDVPIGAWPRAIEVDGGQCLVLPQDRDLLVCLDLATGGERWRAEVPRLTGHLALLGDAVLTGGWRGYTPLRIFDRSSGALCWAESHPTETVLPAMTGAGLLVGATGGRSVRVISVPGGEEIAGWALPEPLRAADTGPAAFVAAGPDRFLLRCGPRTVWEIRPTSGDGGVLFQHDTDLADDGISVAGGEVWVRERLGGQVAVGPPPRRVSPAAACARGVVRVGQGTVVATRRPGILLLTGPDGAVLARAAVDQQITAVYGLDPDTVLVLGKGEVTAVATPPACPLGGM